MENKKANQKKINEKILKEFLYLAERGKDTGILLKKYPGSEDVISGYKKILNGISQFSSFGPAKDFASRSLRNIYALARTGGSGINTDTGRDAIAAARFRPAFIKPLIVFISVLAFFVFSFAGTIYASENSVPGDVLYGVKRAGESIRIAVTPHEKKGGLYIVYLDKRLDEAEAIFSKNGRMLPEETALLMQDIDHTYTKCIEYGRLNNGNNEDLLARMSRVRNRYQQECMQNGSQPETGSSNQYKNNNGAGSKKSYGNESGHELKNKK